MSIRQRLYPGLASLPVLGMHAAHAWFVWNLALEQANYYDLGNGPTPNNVVRMRQLAEARAASQWLAAGSASVQQAALRRHRRTDLSGPSALTHAGILQRFLAARDDIVGFLSSVRHREEMTGWGDIPLADLRAIETIWGEIGRMNEASRPIPEIARLARTGSILMGDVPGSVGRTGEWTA